MDENILKTEEFERKRNYKGLIILIIAIILICIILFFVYKYISSSIKKKREQKKQTVEITTLNSELQNIYGFAISDNYIVALKNDGTSIKIYNLLQGTGNLGDYTYYTYYDNKLYLLYSDNILYTISLESGNRLYELKKYLEIVPVSCINGETSKTNDLAFNKNEIYINNSNCSLTRTKIDKENKKISTDTLKVFNSKNINIEYSNSINSIFVNADNSIYKFDNKSGEISTITSNTSNSIPLEIKSNILIYSNIINNKKVYYGYNVKTGEGSTIVEADDLLIYNKAFIYLKDNTVYLRNGTKDKIVYKAHYDTLSKMELIGKSTLQIVDTLSTDENKKRIINVDLSSKNYKRKENNKEYTNIIEYTK